MVSLCQLQLALWSLFVLDFALGYEKDVLMRFWMMGLVVLMVLISGGREFAPEIVREDHLVEWAQVGMLLVASGIHCRAFRAIARNEADYWIHAGLSLLTFSFAIREMEIDQWNEKYGSLVEVSIRAVNVLLWTAFAVSVMNGRSHIRSNRGQFLGHPVLRISGLGLAVYVLGGLFDKHVFALSRETDLFLEELAEFGASYFLLMAAFFQRGRWNNAESRASSDADDHAQSR
jgi:hypothetical protein